MQTILFYMLLMKTLTMQLDIQDLNNLSAWRNENKSTINSKKTKHCIYGS